MPGLMPEFGPIHGSWQLFSQGQRSDSEGRTASRFPINAIIGTILLHFEEPFKVIKQLVIKFHSFFERFYCQF